MLGNLDSLLDYARIWVRGVVIAAVAVTALALVVGSIVSGYIAGRVSFAAVYDAAVAPPELKAEWARRAKFREEHPDFNSVARVLQRLRASPLPPTGSWRQRTHDRLADAGGLAGALSVTGGWTAVALAWWRRRREQ